MKYFPGNVGTVSSRTQLESTRPHWRKTCDNHSPLFTLVSLPDRWQLQDSCLYRCPLVVWQSRHRRRRGLRNGWAKGKLCELNERKKLIWKTPRYNKNYWLFQLSRNWAEIDYFLWTFIEVWPVWTATAVNWLHVWNKGLTMKNRPSEENFCNCARSYGHFFW